MMSDAPAQVTQLQRLLADAEARAKAAERKVAAGMQALTDTYNEGPLGIRTAVRAALDPAAADETPETYRPCVAGTTGGLTCQLPRGHSGRHEFDLGVPEEAS